MELTTQVRQNRKEINNVKVLPSDNNSPNGTDYPSEKEQKRN